jgi:hypothetical protein
MIVICTQNILNSGSEYNVIIGNKYLVTGISCIPKNNFDTQVLYEVVNDAGNLRPIPAALFEIQDDRCSKYWVTNVSKSGGISIRPKAFFREYFHDDLSEGLIEVVNIFKETVEILKHEFDSDS